MNWVEVGVIDTNLVGPYLLSNEVARRLIKSEKPGRMVNISSMAAFNTGPNSAALSVFLLGFLCTGLAYMGYVVLIKRVGPIKASTVVLIVPVTGMLWANIFLDEIITLTMISGCVLILIGVGLVNFFKNE